LLNLDAPVGVTAGQIYHIVYTNPAQTGHDPTVDYSSLDGLFMATALNPTQPMYDKFHLGALFESDDSGGWIESTNGSSTTPILDVNYADGFDQGDGYIDDALGQPAFIGFVSNGPPVNNGIAQEVFTVPTTMANAIVTSVSVFAARINANTSGLTVTLENGSGTVIEQGTIPATTFPANTPCQAPPPPHTVDCQGTWGTYTFSTPRVLQSGSSYKLVLSASSQTYAVFAIENGFRDLTGSFGPNSVFKATSNFGQYSTDGGATWLKWFNDVGDLQFYFTLLQ